MLVLLSMSHTPVLLNEVIELLNPKPGEVFIDGTIGGGGHARKILERTAPDGKLFGLDISDKAIANLKTALADCGDRVKLIRDNFRNLKRIVYDHAIPHPDGILLDLGFSSDELADPALGISFRVAGPLDMRLSGEGVTAAEVVNSWPEKELVRILRQYGEEKYASRIVKAIVLARKKERLITTTSLVKVIEGAVPRNYEHGRIHPATRTFQALRIVVNDELDALSEFLPQALDVLAPGGRLAVISFHSLEDRMVKRFFREHAGRINVLTKKPIIAGEEETQKNPRSRSAKLRAVTKR